MPRDPKNIWRVPAYLPYVQPPLTDEAVREAERKIGFKLPEEYLALLRIQNGGYIRYTLEDICQEKIRGIGPHYPSLTGSVWEDHDREYVSFELDGLVPIDGDGHWHLCLDYRKNKEHPTITHADFEGDDEWPVADSFADYLAMLKPDCNKTDFFIPNVEDFEALKGALSSQLGVEFEVPSTQGNGYPIHRARAGTKKDPEWIWLSPNLVQRGFIRESEGTREDLQEAFSGLTSRYPEIPDSSIVVDVTEGVRGKVMDACKRLNIDLRPLGEYFV